MFNIDIFSSRLRAVREGRNLSRKEVAELLGVTKTQINDLENGKTGTSMARLVILAEFYKVSTDYLLGITDDPTWRGK